MAQAIVPYDDGLSSVIPAERVDILPLRSARVRSPDILDSVDAPAVIDVITSKDAVSSGARKGLGFVPDYQALTAWHHAERKRREQA